MNSQVIRIPHISDRTLIEHFLTLGEPYGVTSVNLTASGFARLGRVELDDATHEELGALIAHDSYLIESMLMNIRGLVIHFHRGGSAATEKKSATVDELVLSIDTHTATLDNTERINLAAEMTRLFDAFAPQTAPSLGDYTAHLLQTHDKTLERLEQLNESLIRRNVDFETELAQEYQRKGEAQAAEYAVLSASLEKEQGERLAALDAREKQLLERQLKLEKRAVPNVNALLIGFVLLLGVLIGFILRRLF